FQQHFAFADPASSRQKAVDAGAGQGFARTGFSDRGQDVTGRQRQIDIRQGADDAASRRKGRGEIAYFDQGSHLPILGLSASRSQSPNTLTDSDNRTGVTAGKTVIHHSPENR